MRKSLTYKILAAVLALSAANWAVPADVLAGEDANGNYNVTYDGETISDSYKNVYGNGHNFTINGGTINGSVFGVGNSNYDKDASGGNVTISGNATISSDDGIAYVCGGCTTNGNAEYNTVNISDNVTIKGSIGTANVYGGFSSNRNVEYNTVNISDNAIVRGNVFGGYTISGNAEYNTVNISGGTIGGGSTNNGIVGGKTINGSAITILLILATALYQVMFTAAFHTTTVLMITKSSSVVLPILKMLICMAAIKVIATTQAIPLPLTAGKVKRILYKTSTILLLKISTGMKINPYLQLQ